MSTARTWQDTPLAGRLLVEASAGTGKTWTMAALYLRLLLEGEGGQRRRLPDQIVVATFTDAAAQELAERLRARLTHALRLANAGTAGAADPDDPVEAWLAERWQADSTRRQERQHLLAALARLDRAPIGTLHGLCYRLLREQPLAGGFGFAPPALADGRRLHEALARDLLRRIGAGDAPPHAATLPDALADFDVLVAAIAFVLQPGAVVSPPATIAELHAVLDDGTRATLSALAEKSGHYSHAQNSILNAVKAALAFLDGQAPAKSLAALVTPQEIQKERVLPAAREKILTPAFQAAIQRFETLRARMDSPERAFWAHWAPELRRWRERRSAELAELGFDPLIERARDAMLATGSALPDAAFARWPVALVDEFQDTDGTQYALLDRWFRDDHGAPRGLLAMVGDPKQAIYGFRGGDVQAYLRAQAQATATLRLAVNQRSSTAYVAACNALFDGARGVLSSDAAHPIRYAPVRAAGRADARGLHERGSPVTAPLVIHHSAVAGWNAIARPAALEACADLVVQLLEPGRFTFGADGPALAPGDIAVLLRTNAEVDDLRHALRRRGVPCAGQSRQQVFDSPTARDLLLVLHAIQHPGDSGALRAALLTPFGGLPWQALREAEAGGELAAWRERLIRWRERWRREGVLAAVLALLDAVRPALAAHPQRERLVTDLRHLGELLQARESAGHAPAALLDWLRAQRAGDAATAEASGERSLRLESDARRVRLMTLHASKGLEFPVVLLPTLWGHEAQAAKPALAASDADGTREALFESDALRALRGEQQDERFRLLYVALTRAVHACHLFVLPPERPATKRATTPKRDPERSALDALLARSADALRDHPNIAWHPHWPLPPDVPYVATAQADAAPADAPTGNPPAPGPFALPGRWSFSRLAGGHERQALESAAADDESPPDADPADALPPTAADAAARAPLADVGGTGFGQALHDLLETHAPGQRFADDLEHVRAALEAHAVQSRDGRPLAVIAAEVAALLDGVLATALHLPGSATPLRLGELPAAKRRSELAFHFVLAEVSLGALRAACAAHGEADLVPEGTAATLSGWMEGSVDLVFEHAGRVHVLDWKSNVLAAPTDTAVRAVMDAHHYRFQAFLYTVALHRLLRQRLGARYRIAEHLGAPVYVFLRAAGLGGGRGLWTQRFPDALIEAADRVLAGGAA